MSRKLFVLLFVVLLLSLLLAGCGGLPNSGGVQDAAQGAVCTAVTGLDTAVVQLEDINVDASAADVKGLLAKLDGPVQAVRTASEAVGGGRLDDLFAAYDNLAAKVSALPDDASLEDSLAEIQESVAEVQDKLEQAISTLNCEQ